MEAVESACWNSSCSVGRNVEGEGGVGGLGGMIPCALRASLLGARGRWASVRGRDMRRIDVQFRVSVDVVYHF
jgi:hypothetical protein